MTSKQAYHFNPKFLMLLFINSFNNGELCFRYKHKHILPVCLSLSTQIQKCIFSHLSDFQFQQLSLKQLPYWENLFSEKKINIRLKYHETLSAQGKHYIVTQGLRTVLTFFYFLSCLYWCYMRFHWPLNFHLSLTMKILYWYWGCPPLLNLHCFFPCPRRVTGGRERSMRKKG